MGGVDVYGGRGVSIEAPIKMVNEVDVDYVVLQHITFIIQLTTNSMRKSLGGCSFYQECMYAWGGREGEGRERGGREREKGIKSEREEENVEYGDVGYDERTFKDISECRANDRHVEDRTIATLTCGMNGR